MKAWIFSRLDGKLPLKRHTRCCHCTEWVKWLSSRRYLTPSLLNLHLKKRGAVKNERLHLQRSSVKNEEEEEEGLNIALFPPLLLGNGSSS